ERTEFVQWVEPAEGAARVELYLRRWTAPDDLTLTEAPAFGPAEPEALEALLERHPGHERLLRILARLHSVQGNLTRFAAAMKLRAAANWSPGARREYRRVAGVLEELDTDWLPRLTGRRRAEGTAAGDRVCHLFKVTYPFENTGGAIRNLNTVASQRAA